LIDWHSERHPGDVTENGAATFDDVIYDWRETSLVCKVDITDVILPSVAEYLTLTIHMKAIKDPGISSAHGPRLCCIQKGAEYKCFVRPDLDGQ